MNLRDRIAEPALYLLAFTWSFAFYETLPYLFLPVSALCGAVLAGVVLLEVAGGERFRAPFELIWPVGIAALAATANGTPVLAALGRALVFLAILHEARSTRLALRCLWLAVLGGLVPLTLSLASYSGAISPVLAVPGTPWLLSEARSLDQAAQSVLLLAALFAALVLPAARPARLCRLRQGAALSAGLLALGGLFLWYLRSDGAVWTLPRLTQTAALLWLHARIFAKLELERRSGAEEARPGLMAFVFAAALLSVLLPPALPKGSLVLLALTAAYATPFRRTQARPWTGWAALALPAVALALLNLVIIFPANPHDQRNYEHRAAALLDAERPADLARHLTEAARLRPGDRRVDLWWARLHLARGEAEAAAEAFAAACRPPSRRRWPAVPPPNQAEGEAFLTRLRDHCSALPETARGLAYERALAAAGRPESALHALHFRAAKAKAMALSPEGPRTLMSYLLQNETLAVGLGDFDTGELVAILGQCGARIVTAPETFPKVMLPIALVAQPEESGVAIWGWSGGTPFGAYRGHRTGAAPSGGSELRWGDLYQVQTWRSVLSGPARTALAEARFRSAPEFILAAPGTAPWPGTPKRAIILFLPAE